MVNKDLTFIHLGNESYVDGLVNFEKLRMLAKEVSELLWSIGPSSLKSFLFPFVNNNGPSSSYLSHYSSM